MKGNIIYKCAVNGDLGRVGKYGAICAKSNARGGCGAHGNTKCIHKIKSEVEKNEKATKV